MKAKFLFLATVFFFLACEKSSEICTECEIRFEKEDGTIECIKVCIVPPDKY